MFKIKSQIKKYLWEKIREPKIMKCYNPRYLMENLKENDELEEILNSWETLNNNNPLIFFLVKLKKIQIKKN